MSRRACLGAMLAFGGFQTFWNQAIADEPIVLDFAQSHVFEGFGVHAWMGSPHIPERDKLLRALNARFVRASLPGLIPDNQLPEHASVDNIVSLIQKNASSGTDADMIKFRDELAGLGIRLHVIFWGMPAPWRHEHPNAVHLAATEHLADYANFIVGHLLYMKRMAIVPDYVELTNEPNGVWNTQFTPEQYDQLVVLTRGGLDQSGLADFRIEGPGTSNRPGDFMRELVRTGHINLLGAYSFHEYDTRDGVEPAGLRVIEPSVTDAPAKPITITEFSSSNPRWNKPSTLPDGKPDPRPWSENPDFGISVAGEALQLIADGAREILVWHLEDLPWQTGRTGLLDGSGRTKAVAAALLSLFGLVRPGSHIAHLSFAIDKVPFVAFLNGSDITVCAVNLTEVNLQFYARFVETHYLKTTSNIATFRGGFIPNSEMDGNTVTVDETGLMSIRLSSRSILAAKLIFVSAR